jgi:hypothetical protein
MHETKAMRLHKNVDQIAKPFATHLTMHSPWSERI